MDFTSLIESFATGTFVVTRRASGGFKRGVALATTDSTFSIRASVQPATGNDLQRLPELRRTDETRVLFTTTMLTPGSSTLEADRVAIDGLSWEIQHVETWVQPGLQGTGYRCVAQRPDE